MDTETDPTTVLLGALRSVVAWIDDAAVPGMIIGGVAASILGRPRTTRDVDALVLADRDEWAGLLARSKEHGLVPRVEDALAFARQARVLLLRHEASGIDVDVSFGALPFEAEALERAVSVQVGDVTLPLPTPEDLIIMKAVAHRPRDLADIEAIVEAHPHLDRERVIGWVAEFAEVLDMPEILSDLTARL